MQHGATAARATHHVDTIACAGFEIDISEGLQTSQTQAGGRKSIQTDGATDIAPRTRVEQSQVAAHVLLAGRRRVEDQLEPTTGLHDGALRH